MRLASLFRASGLALLIVTLAACSSAPRHAPVPIPSAVRVEQESTAVRASVTRAREKSQSVARDLGEIVKTVQDPALKLQLTRSKDDVDELTNQLLESEQRVTDLTTAITHNQSDWMAYSKEIESDRLTAWQEVDRLRKIDRHRTQMICGGILAGGFVYFLGAFGARAYGLALLDFIPGGLAVTATAAAIWILLTCWGWIGPPLRWLFSWVT